MQSRRSIGPSSVGLLSQRENFRAQRSDAQTGQFGQRPSYGLPATDTGGLHAPGQHLARFAAAFGHRFVAAPGFAGRETASAIRPRLGPASENRLPARIARSTRFARRQKRPPPPARYHFAVGRKLDLAGSARFRTDLQQAILEAADPLRNGRCGTDPLLPRKQHLQTSQTTIQRPAGERYGPHGGVGRRTIPYDPQQYPPTDLSRAYGRLLYLFPG